LFYNEIDKMNNLITTALITTLKNKRCLLLDYTKLRAVKKSFSQSKSVLYDIGLQLRIPKIKKEKSIIGNYFKF